MEFIMEIILDLILEGSVEAASSKKVPLPVRILASVILLAVYGGLIGFLVYIGIHEKIWLVLVLAAVILIITVLAFYHVYKKRRA